MSAKEKTKLFYKEGPKRILKHILFWFSILTFFTLFGLAINDNGLWYSFKINIIFLPQDIFLVYIILFLVIPRLYLKKRPFLFVLSLIAVFSLNLIFSFLVDGYVAPAVGVEIEDVVLAKRLLSSILTFTFIASIASILKLIDINNIILMNKEIAESKFHNAEIALLRSQINPHFLFNVFNNIDELIYKDRDKASDTLAFLSDSLRYVLQESDKELVPVKEEIKFIRSYLEVASISFNDPDFILFNVKDEMTEVFVAPMIFIPFIENCVKHCNRKAQSPGIEIEIGYQPHYISLYCCNRIKDGKPGADPNGGYGLVNAKKRLDLIYKDNYVLNIDNDGNSFSIDLKISL